MNLHLVTRAGSPFGASRAGQALRLLFGCPRRRSAVCGLFYRFGARSAARQAAKSFESMVKQGDTCHTVESMTTDPCAGDGTRMTGVVTMGVSR